MHLKQIQFISMMSTTAEKSPVSGRVEMGMVGSIKGIDEEV